MFSFQGNDGMPGLKGDKGDPGTAGLNVRFFDEILLI